eukprot:CAMPEP_0202399818 /NCGR_PEP_ID=MMETSP1128-20130828/2275_1 /ASSEMBLY_ACC=CAM_ASM_000463 /TAXON_ID=3047 /ORGANISM="Dunaliella tertiolecta, Strain CCMP1320" /LENGTH=483 /DNA_ID=CAMNT_0049003223 /DNA_START=238 /DNA_END=1689 /DNA_ORIENTATION=-
MIGGLLSKLGIQGAPGQAGFKPKSMPPVWFSGTAPSWESLESMAKAKQQALGVDFWADPNLGPTNAKALKRNFGQPDSAIRVKLYRDHASWCPYCHKIWLMLEEKQIPYIVEKINMRCYGPKPPEFMAKVPTGLLPVMELDGGPPITESLRIMMLLEQEFPDHKPLIPRGSSQEVQRAEQLMRLERRLFSDWLGWACSDWNQAMAKARSEAVLDVIEAELKVAGGPFFFGKDISLADINMVPMLERMVASLAYYKGFFIRGTGRWPAIEAWFAALEQRPTYLGTHSDYYQHCHDLPPQMGGCYFSDEGLPVAAQIDGVDGESWRLPLAPLSATSLPEPFSPGDSPPLDTLEAAASLIKNHAAVTRFALRGVGKPGPRPVSAPLSDPSAIPALEHMAAADMALRHVAHALLVGVEEKQVSEHALQVTSSQPSGPAADLTGVPIVPAATYLRDRVGVPRDMRFPAARQLRAHLNWLIDSLEAAAA